LQLRCCNIALTLPYSWMAQLLELPQCRSRVLRTFAVDPDGTSLLVTRYVSPLPLPAQLHAAASTPSALPGISATEAVMLKVGRQEVVM
jgi:hypothetical protein